MNKSTFRKLAFITLLCTGAMLFAAGAQQPAVGAGGRPTLQIGIQSHAFIIDHKENYLTRYLENLHNIDLNFFHLPTDAADSRTRLSLLAASNDLPETLWGGGMTREQILEYGSNGALRSLNQYLANPSATPHFNRIPQEYRETMLRDTRSADGNYYSFAMYQPETWNLTAHRYYINRSWLERLGLQEPTNTDQLRQVLIAFRDRDPNGNGRQDEIGVFGWFRGGYGENVIAALINSFIFWNPGQLSVDASGNTVIAPVTQAGFRTALQYLNGLFRDRLLDASTFTVDQATFRGVINSEPMVVGLTSMGSIGNFPNADFNPHYLAMAPLMAPLSSPISPGYTPYQDYTASQASFITNRARDVDLAVRVMDSFFEPTLSIIARFGEEDVDWTRDPAILATDTNAMVELGIYPGLSMTQIRNVWTIPEAKHWANVNPRFTPLEIGNTIGNLEVPYDPSLHSTTHNARNFQLLIPRRPQHVLPILHYNAADGATLAPIIITINEYINQSIAEFTIGTRDINSDAAWNAYLRDLDAMGLQTWIRLAQTTYNNQR